MIIPEIDTNLNIMRSLKLKIRANIKETFNQSILLLNIIMNSKILANENDLRISDFSFWIILESEFEFRESIEQLRRYLVEENRTITVEFGCDSNRRPFLE